jgi:hypothetical protein
MGELAARIVSFRNDRLAGLVRFAGLFALAFVVFAIVLLAFGPLPGLEWVPQYVVVNAFQG